MLASLFASAFRPTLREFDFKISKYTSNHTEQQSHREHPAMQRSNFFNFDPGN